MVQIKLEDIRKQGINKGCLVEVILKEGVILDLRTLDLVSYYGPEKDTGKPSAKKCSGYFMVQRDKKEIALSPEWDYQLNRYPKDGHTGVTSIGLESIYSIYPCVKK